MFIKTDVPKWIRKKGAIPTAGFVVPGANHHAAVYNNYPDRYVAMFARADIQILGLFELREHWWRKTLCRRRVRLFAGNNAG